jgi:hypothetical protein
MNLEKAVIHGKHGRHGIGVSRHFAVRRKLAKTRKNSNACLGESCHLMGDSPISFKPMLYSVISVFSVDEKRF